MNPFRPSLSHSAIDNLSYWFNVTIFSQSTLAGGLEKKTFFSPGPETALGGPNSASRSSVQLMTLIILTDYRIVMAISLLLLLLLLLLLCFTRVKYSSTWL